MKSSMLGSLRSTVTSECFPNSPCLPFHPLTPRSNAKLVLRLPLKYSPDSFDSVFPAHEPWASSGSDPRVQKRGKGRRGREKRGREKGGGGRGREREKGGRGRREGKKKEGGGGRGKGGAERRKREGAAPQHGKCLENQNNERSLRQHSLLLLCTFPPTSGAPLRMPDPAARIGNTRSHRLLPSLPDRPLQVRPVLFPGSKPDTSLALAFERWPAQEAAVSLQTAGTVRRVGLGEERGKEKAQEGGMGWG